MTEKRLHRILDQAELGFGLLGAVVVPRIGSLLAGDNIVLVAVAAGHRGEAFSACEMIMDLCGVPVFPSRGWKIWHPAPKSFVSKPMFAARITRRMRGHRAESGDFLESIADSQWRLKVRAEPVSP